MLDGIGTTTYAYYPIAAGTLGAGRLASVDGPLLSDTLTYTYDELGRNKGYAINGVGETRTFDALGPAALRDQSRSVLSATPTSGRPPAWIPSPIRTG